MPSPPAPANSRMQSLGLPAAAALLMAAGWLCSSVHATATPAKRTTAADSVPIPHLVHSRSGPLARGKSKIVEFDTAPFPYKGLVPRTGQPFLNVVENGRRGHRTGTGRVYWEDETYKDRQVLLHLPKG